MFDPEMVVSKILQGRGDPSWRVFYGHSSPLASAIILGVFTFIFVGICEFIAAVGLTIAGILSTSTFSLDPLPMLAGFGVIGVAIPTIAAIVVAVFAKNWASRAKDSMLVMLPEGVVECKGYSNPSHRSWQVFDYANIATNYAAEDVDKLLQRE